MVYVNSLTESNPQSDCNQCNVVVAVVITAEVMEEAAAVLL